ncbi:hypothetical protein CDV36_016492 [Fusarium kuroshium]|uniref:Uncharacterized protein n=1 Tax=Fusarium kuroshium TaxID=2010991 RepID=A0A3M2QMZ9_9HYPO|nr:hypothetical protein CDV36_016492 [Fusarium kuroshium]
MKPPMPTHVRTELENPSRIRHQYLSHDQLCNFPDRVSLCQQFQQRQLAPRPPPVALRWRKAPKSRTAHSLLSMTQGAHRTRNNPGKFQVATVCHCQLQGQAPVIQPSNSMSLRQRHHTNTKFSKMRDYDRWAPKLPLMLPGALPYQN